MKKIAARILSATLAIIMLTSALPVFAENAVYPEISGHWAEAALLRAVEDGYIVGSGRGLDPDGVINRAQMCTVLNRVLAAEAKADIADKTNVSQDCWYRAEMEKAAYMGCVNNFDAATMEAPLNRKDAITILSRAFSLTECAPDYSVLSGFSDASQFTGEAKDAAASLVADGFLNGSGGKLMAAKKITRAEFVTLLYRVIDDCKIYGCSETDVTLPTDGSAVIRGCALSAFSAAGSYDTVALGQESGNVRFSPASAEKVIVGAGSGKTTVGGKIGALSVTGEGRSVEIASGVVAVSAVSAANAQITVAQGAVVEELLLLPSAKNCVVTINGTVKKLTVNAAGCTVTGAGRVEAAQITASDCKASVKAYGGGLGQTEIAFTAPETLSAGDKLTVQAQFKNAPSASNCTLQWYTDGKADTAESFALSSGAVAVHSPAVKYSKNMADKMAVGLAVTYCQNGVLEYKYAAVDVALENYPASHYVAEETARVNALITTYQYPSKVLYNSTLYSDWSLKNAVGSVANGTSVTCISSVGLSSVQIKLPNGAVGWLTYNNISRASGNCTRASDYAAADKELWVNGKKYTSSTDYLVWVSLSCQKVNVFTKSAGGWALSKVFPCASGANTTPTPVGTYKISYKQDRWAYNTYWCGPVTGFYNGYAFHSWLTHYDGTAYDHTMGRPVSHGCVRMEDAGAQYMHNLPMNTTIVVF